MHTTQAGAQFPIPVADETWEYTYMDVKMGTMAEAISTMNRAGAEGWEMVCGLPLSLGGGFHDPSLTTMALFVFKRRRQS